MAEFGPFLRLDGWNKKNMPAHSIRLESATPSNPAHLRPTLSTLPQSINGHVADPSFPDHVVRAALRDYRTSRDTAKAVATRHRIDVKRLRRWVDAAGYSRRPLGRKPLTEPSAAQKAILARFDLVSITQLALEAGTSKQYISELAKRWPDWVGGKQTPSRRAKSSHGRG